MEEYDSVAYVASPPVLEPTALDVSRRVLEVAAALLAGDGTALKNESSGLAHGRDTWLALAHEAAAAEDEPELAATLHRAWVKRPIGSDGLLYTVGMHLLGQPDVELDPGGPVDEPEVLRDHVATMDALAYYLLMEQPERGIQDGEGFRVSAEGPRWVMSDQPCERFDLMDDISYNPYGYWRLTPG